MNKPREYHYTDSEGEQVTVPTLEYLDTGYGYTDEGERVSVTRYWINANTDEDGESVWLDDNDHEVIDID